MSHDDVHPSRITVYLLHTRKNDALKMIDNKYRMRGLNVKVIIQGWRHTERDAAMTAASDYDILWVRSDEETKTLYGAKYRAGRISGTQNNQNRRKESALQTDEHGQSSYTVSRLHSQHSFRSA